MRIQSGCIKKKLSGIMIASRMGTQSACNKKIKWWDNILLHLA